MTTLRHFGLYLALLVTSNSFALPGFVELLKATHPDMSPKCTTCHNLGADQKPTNLNATIEGKALYLRLKSEAARFNIKHAARNVFDTADLVVFGDTRTNDSVHKDIVQKICSEKPGAVIHTGDMVASGASGTQWKNALKAEECLVKTKLLHSACGNHEGSYCTKNVLRDALGNHDNYYTFDFKGFTFIALDSQSQTDEEIQWLSALPEGKRYIPFFHHAPYPTIAGHGSDSGVKQRFIPQFKRLGVKIAFNGHNHGYDRAVVDGIQYVTIGGGGAPLYPCGPANSNTQACDSEYGYAKCRVPTPGTLDCQTVSQSGESVDTFTVEYP